MATVLAVLALYGLGVGVASAPAQGTSAALQVIQRELSTLPHWNHYLPDDIDANNDGELSEEEVGEKVKSYMREVFNQLDKDSNHVVIQDEVRKASIDVDFINKIVDIAFKSYPIKLYLGHGDRNQDGFISEDDFYLPENDTKKNEEEFDEHWNDYTEEAGSWVPSINIQSGPIHLAGGKEASMGELHIGHKPYIGDVNLNMAKVVCRQLGFNQGNPKITWDLPFFERSLPPYENEFVCNGSEATLGDCGQTIRQLNLWQRQSAGIICNSGEDLDEKYGRIHHSSFTETWELRGRVLFLADTNGDEKVSVDELKAKVKEIIEAVFRLLDQTNDGSFSEEDVSTLSLRLPDVIDVVNKLFEILDESILSESIYMYLYNHNLYSNPEGRITWNEMSLLIDSSQDEGLLGLLAKHLDANQDGLIQSHEPENFIKMMFNNLDVDDSSTITLDDLFKFMKKSQFTCLQIEGVKTFVEGWMELIGTQVEKVLDYFFAYLDLDSNGEIPLDEFYNLPVCNKVDPNDQRACRDLLGEFFLSAKPPVVPNMKYKVAGPPSQREGNDVREKLANSFCLAMQP